MIAGPSEPSEHSGHGCDGAELLAALGQSATGIRRRGRFRGARLSGELPDDAAGVIRHIYLGPRTADVENFIGYRSVRGSKYGVWGLFVGNTYTMSHGPYASRDVHVYDWKGRLRQILRLSTPVDDIAVSEDFLYGATNQLVPKILKWTLPGHLLDELRDPSLELGPPP